MATTLAQLLAVEKGVRQRDNDQTRALERAVHQDVLYTGLTRTYQPFADDGTRYPDERTNAQLNIGSALADFLKVKTRTIDVTASKDETNTRARGDIEIDGQVLAAGVPSVTLLSLEKQLDDLITFLRQLPVLDPAETWVWDKNAGFFRSEPSKTVKSAKQHVPFVKWAPDDPATSKHPAQVDVVIEDIPQGEWTVTKFSGAMPADRKRDLTERAHKLRDAVKYAREAANRAEVTDREIAAGLFTWLTQ